MDLTYEQIMYEQRRQIEALTAKVSYLQSSVQLAAAQQAEREHQATVQQAKRERQAAAQAEEAKLKVRIARQERENNARFADLHQKLARIIEGERALAHDIQNSGQVLR